jgi:transcriptional regulator with XRE-family HTH domain
MTQSMHLTSAGILLGLAQNTVAKVLVLERSKRGWTQDDLAKASGIPRQHISLIERRLHPPSLRTLAHLALAFGCSIHHLLKEPA